MKLYYDMLVPYMPDTSLNEKNEAVPDEVRAAGRQAMQELTNFQVTGNLMALYQSVLYACGYAKKDFIDTVTNLEDIPVDNDKSASYLIDTAALMLFKSINPENKFDIDLYTAYILTASHILFMQIQAAMAEEAKDNSEISSDSSSED